MKVLVTGGAGFIGGHLVERFLAEGFQVRVLDSLEPKIHPRGRPEWLSEKVEFIHGDVTDRTLLEKALHGVEVISHQAAYQDYMPDFSRFMQVNAVATALIFELIVQKRLPIKKVIIASSQAIYGEGQYQCAMHGFLQPQTRSPYQLARGDWDLRCPECANKLQPRLLREEYMNPYNQYAVSKLAQEKTALGLGWLHGIPTVALRYSITQGARQSLHNHYSGVCRIFFTRASQSLPLIIYEDGLQTRDFIHIADVVEANMLVLAKEEANFQAFNVGSGKAVTILDYAHQVLDKLGSDAKLQISGEYRRGDNRHSVSSIDKLLNLGWKPQRTLSHIMDDFLDWIRASGGVPLTVHDAYTHMKTAGVVLSSTS